MIYAPQTSSGLASLSLGSPSSFSIARWMLDFSSVLGVDTKEKKKSPKCIYIQQPLPYIWKHKHTVSKTLPSASPKLRFMRRLNHAQKTSMNCTLAQCHPYFSSRLGHADLHVQLILRNRILYLLLLVERNAPLHFHENEARLSHFETSIFYVESPNAN